MARCDECLYFELCEALEKGNGLMRVHPIHCGFYKPTADVAPKSETANEIAEWLDDEISKMPCYDREFELYVKLTIEQLKKRYERE